MRSLLLCALLLAVAGCGSTRGYEGPELPPEETAGVHGLIYPASLIPIKVHSVDGKKHTWLSGTSLAEVLPGPRTVQLITTNLGRAGDRSTYVGYYDFSFTAKKGHAYTFALYPAGGTQFNSDSSACMYEEWKNDPGARINRIQDLRTPGANAIRVTCTRIQIKKVD